MVKHGVGALVAVNEEDTASPFRGIITEVGFMKALILPGGSSIKREEATVRDLMTPAHKKHRKPIKPNAKQPKPAGHRPKTPEHNNCTF